MAITHVATTVTQGTATSLAATKPAGLQNGDVLVASIAQNGTFTIGAPSGWTQRHDVQTGGANPRSVTYHKVITDASSEPSTYTWNWTFSTAASIIISAYRGVDTSSPINVSATNGNSSSTNPVYPSVTTTVDNCLVVHVVASSTTGTISTPTGDTLRGTDTNDFTLPANQLSDFIQATAGATGTKTSTAAGSAWNTQSIALTPIASTAIGKPLDVRWSLRAPVFDSLDARWSLRSTINDSLDLRWGIRTPVSDTLDTRWSLRSTLGDSLEVRWALRAAIADSLDSRWAIRTAVADELDARWGVRVAVADEMDLRWQVLALLDSVGLGLDLRWGVRAAAGDSLDTRWALNQIIGKTNNIRWSLRANMAADADLRWSIRSLSDADLELLWRVMFETNPMAADLQLVWKVLANYPSRSKRYVRIGRRGASVIVRK